LPFKLSIKISEVSEEELCAKEVVPLKIEPR